MFARLILVILPAILLGLACGNLPDLDRSLIKKPVGDQGIPVQLGSPPSSLLEGDDAYLLPVSLSKKPNFKVVLTLESDTPAALVVNGSPVFSLTFTPDNWQTSQLVELLPLNDSDLINNPVQLKLVGDSTEPMEIPITVVDRDTPNIFIGGATSLNEGATSSLFVRLTHKPNETVSVDLTASDAGLNFSSDGSTFFPTIGLQFSPTNYSQPQAVFARSTADSDFIPSTTNVNANAIGYGTGAHSIQILETKMELLITGDTSVIEEGLSEVKIQLPEDPGAEMILDLSVTGAGPLNVTPTSVTFNSGNYNTDQVVVLSTSPDVDLVNSSALITMSGTGFATATRSITIVDNDVQTFILDGVTQTSEGSTPTLDVSLASLPVDSVFATLVSYEPSVSVNPTSLTFTPADWDTPQTVTLTTTVDGDLATELAQIVVYANGVDSATHNLVVFETPEVVMSGTTMNEDSSTNITITLSDDPGPVDRIVDFASSDTGLLTVSPSQLTFNSSNFQTGLSLSLTAPEDANSVDDSVTLTASGSQVTGDAVTIDITDTSAEITSFVFRQATNPSLTQDHVLTIDQGALTITGTLPFGTTTWLVPEIIYTGDSLTPMAGVSMYFGTQQNYTVNSPAGNVIYTVTVDGWDYQPPTSKVFFLSDGYGNSFAGKLCAQGENDDATCSGAAGTYQYCDADDYSCEAFDGYGYNLDGSGNSQVFATCDDLNTNPPGGYEGYTNWFPASFLVQQMVDIAAAHSYTFPADAHLNGAYHDSFSNEETLVWISGPGAGFFQDSKTSSYAVRCFALLP